MLKQISKEVWQLYLRQGSNCYVIKKKILIDCASFNDREELIKDFRDLKIKLQDIRIILLTHLHYDHIGNLALFPNAKIYTSTQELKDIKKHGFDFIKEKDSKWFSEIIKIKFFSIKNFKNKNFKVIKVPGHTCGSLAFLFKDILFSGDTIFDAKGLVIGRTDLPTSRPEKMQESIDKLKKLKFKVLCPGH